MKFIAVLTLTLWIFSCGSSDAVGKRITIEDPEHHIKDSPDILKFDSVLYTGWYFVSDMSTGYKKQLLQSKDSFDINPVPIVTATNFDNVSLFHEKDCWALFTWLDKRGSQALNAALQKAKGKQLAFILDNQLLRLQLADYPQFANVQDNADPRVYGQVLTFPCNSFSPAELKNYQTILKSER
jgi:hypothetical protein